jgi:hypothetical protein
MTSRTDRSTAIPHYITLDVDLTAWFKSFFSSLTMHRLIVVKSLSALLWASLINAILLSGVFFPLFIDPLDDCSGWNTIGFAYGFSLMIACILICCSRNGAGLVPFYVSINPANGPGGHPGSQPPLKFQECIPTLNKTFESSVPGTTFTMGYVDTNRGKRAARAVLQDIDTYARWHAPYRPNGIYFDRTPSDTASSELIGEYAQHVRDVFGEGSIVSCLISAGDMHYISLV